jgi:DNA/RNA-binding protein KIN17
MGKKDGFLTPKAIANRIKAKGLQKLRWYCQMCQKQCRDENGFKCHCMSESHQRQMSLFAERPGKFLDTFSQEFESTFMEVLKRRFGTKRVSANLVYQEYISDRHHTHMNATTWVTLTGFVQHLGKSGKCMVEETPKGWYIQYINRDPDVIARQEALAKKERMDLDDEERTQMLIERRILESQKLISPGGESVKSPVIPLDSSEPIKFSLGTRKPESASPTTSANPDGNRSSTSSANSPSEPTPEKNETTENLTDKDHTEQASASSASKSQLDKDANNKQTKETSSYTKFSLNPPSSSSSTHNSASQSKSNNNDKKRKSSVLDELIMEQEKAKEKRNRKDYWITPGIIVKVLNKTLANGKYYKQKGEVQELIDRYIAQIKMIDSGDVLRLDQSQLETVIPQIGGKLRIVNGAYRGETAMLLGLDVEKFSAKVKITSGPNFGRVIPAIEYEDVCKLAQ